MSRVRMFNRWNVRTNLISFSHCLQDIRSFFTVGAKKSTQPKPALKESKKKAVIVSSDEDDPPPTKDKKSASTPVSSNKRRLVYSDDDDDNHTPSRKKPSLSKAAKPKDQPKLKLVEDVAEMFGDAPIKRVEKPTANKTMTEDELNDHFMDDLDISAVPDVDMNVNTGNGVAKDVEKAEPMDDSVIEGTPKVRKPKERNEKRKSAKKPSLDSS